MKTITFDIRSAPESMQDTLDILRSKEPARTALFTFTTPELLWQVLNGERWQILKLLCEAGPLPLATLAQKLNRDTHAVRADIEGLLNAGIVNRKSTGDISFPYREIRLDFLFKAS